MDYLDLRSLQVFVAVCEMGSMTRAAEALGITQPAVSQSIREIEGFVGVALIDRSLRPSRPTPAGSVLYQRGRSILADAREAHILTWQYGAETFPTLRIGLNFTLSRQFTTELVSVLRHQPKPPHLIVFNGGDTDHIHELVNRRLDVIISADAAEHLEGYERHEIARESFLAILPRSAIRAGKPAGFDQARSGLPLIRYSPRLRVGQQIERHLRRIKLSLPRTVELESPDSLLEMVSEGLGWAIVTPLNIIMAPHHAANITAMPLPGPGFNRRLTLIARKGEMSGIPSRLANISREILARSVSARLSELSPLLSSSFSVVGPVGEQGSAHPPASYATSTTISISTGTLSGNSETPTADRA